MKTSNLRLTPEQETSLKEYLKRRFESLEATNAERIQADQKSWLIYRNERSDRENPDTIFGFSNTPVPLTSLVVDHFVSRTEEDLTGTSPYFRFDAQGPSFEKTADDFNRYFNWKLESQAKTRSVYEEAYVQLYVQRNTILKATYKESISRWLDRQKKALFNTETGEFEEIENLGYIIEGEAQFAQAPDPITGQPMVVLVQDPTFVFNPNIHEFRTLEQGVWMEEIKYKGAKAEVVDYNRFLLPPGRWEEADICCELYDKPLSWCREMWLQRPGMSFEEFKGKVAKDASKKLEKEGEPKEVLDFDKEDPVVTIREFWVKRDVLGLGFPQDFVVFTEPDSNTLIYYEFTASVSPDNAWPYTVFSIGKDRSLVEIIKPYQEYIDKQFNSESYRNELASNPLTGVVSQAFEEEPDDIEIYPGVQFSLKEGSTMDEAVQYSVMPNVDAKTQQLIDFVFGIVQLWLGVSNLAQGDYQALAPANTATGVEATLREASKIGRRWMRKIIRGLEDNLFKLVQVTLSTIDEAEVFEYMEGEVRAFAQMNPADLEDLDVKVELVLAQNQGQREIERTDLALRTQERYFQYPPEIRPFARPLLVRILQQVGFEQVDVLLPEAANEAPSTRDEGMEGDLPSPESNEGNVTGAVQGSGNSNTAGQNQYV